MRHHTKRVLTLLLFQLDVGCFRIAAFNCTQYFVLKLWWHSNETSYDESTDTAYVAARFGWWCNSCFCACDGDQMWHHMIRALTLLLSQLDFLFCCNSCTCWYPPRKAVLWRRKSAHDTLIPWWIVFQSLLCRIVAVARQLSWFCFFICPADWRESIDWTSSSMLHHKN